MNYTAEVEKHWKPCMFTARCRETGDNVISADPEHTLCHAMTLAGREDGPIQFYRGRTPSLAYPSIHRAGRMRIAVGDKGFPYVLRDRQTAPQLPLGLVFHGDPDGLLTIPQIWQQE